MLKDFWNKNKDKPLFKGKTLAAILVIAAVAVNFIFTDRNDDKTGEEKSSSGSVSTTAEEKPPPKEFHIGASNVIVLAGCITALAVVKYRDNNLRK